MKEIVFRPSSKSVENIIPRPKPAKEYIPEWFKKTKIFDGNRPLYQEGSITNKTVKSCVPFFDAYQTGYIQETWCDIYISAKDEDTFEYHYAAGPEIIAMVRNGKNKVSDVFLDIDIAWQVHWMPKLEKGYSLLFTHPLNRLDLPFVSTTGVVDSDNFHHLPGGSYPFYIYKNFEGIIPAGTPMYQMIPIKRDSWKSRQEAFNQDRVDKNTIEIRKHFVGSYKRLFHAKKHYE